MQEIVIVGADGKEHVFPDGFDPKKAAAIVRQQSEAPQESKGDLGRFAGYKRIGDAIIGAGKAALNNPVQAGAMAGGMLAAPFTGGGSIPVAMAAAGLGAAGGAGIGSIVNAARGGDNGPKTAAGVAGTMAGEGALGAAGQGLGAGASKLLKVGGKLVYKAALRPSMALQREFGDVAETGLREGARVSEAGATKVQGRLSANSAKTKDMIAAAQAGGASPITPQEVASEFGDVFQQGRRQSQLGRPDPRPAVVDRLKAFGAKNQQGIPLDRAQELKGEAQDLASRAYRAADRGGPMTDLSAEADKAMARGLRAGIEKRVPGVRDVNADSQQLIGLARALEDASMRNVSPIGGPRALLGDFIPSMSSQAGIGMARASRAPLGASLRTALIAALGGQQD